jgi:hypothetical protein
MVVLGALVVSPHLHVKGSCCQPAFACEGLLLSARICM